MSAHRFAVFHTAIGACGIAWGESGVVGVQLPEHRDHATRDRLRRRFSDASEATPPPAIQQAIDGIVALLHGEMRDLSFVMLDMQDVPPLRRSIYAVLRSIPAGATLSYGEVAARLGDGSTARDVGEAMGKNPFPIIVPCHRVVAAGGKLGGFSATGGVTAKLRLLNIEGALVGEAPTLFDALPLHAPPRPPSRTLR
ncbi:MAG TPA: methylated-DNA--[protein]-cysteine S-methyltransferase [Acetobacteraceae bacterium]|jgi:methylated-DNA-[protein]-cysteine S-methyltransferase